jgi:hypothetical protein
MILQLNCEPHGIELSLLLIGVKVLTTILCQVTKLLSVLIHRMIPLAKI